MSELAEKIDGIIATLGKFEESLAELTKVVMQMQDTVNMYLAQRIERPKEVRQPSFPTGIDDRVTVVIQPSGMIIAKPKSFLKRPEWTELDIKMKNQGFEWHSAQNWRNSEWVKQKQ